MTAAEDKPRDIEDWLSKLGLPSADRDYQPGHERVHALIAALEKKESLHQPKLRVRVAGTNGKGSTSHFLAVALQTCGLKVGLYTSPHLMRFHERIRVCNQDITDVAMTMLMEQIMPLALEVETSYFETATVLALLHFSHEQVDVEILEAGVGAKLDATTAVPADVALLTPIAKDHQDWLGHTLSEITKEKAFVFQGCDVTLSAPQSSEVLETLSETHYNINFSQSFSKPLAMLGEHQQHNAGLAWAALQAIRDMNNTVGSYIDMKVCEQAIQETQIAGRLEYVSVEDHHFWLDAAHNEHAVSVLLPTLAAMKKFDMILLCTREDRDLSMCVSSLKVFTDNMVVMTGARDYDYTSVADALSTEVNKLKNGKVLVLGSFVTLSATKKWIQQHEF